MLYIWLKTLQDKIQQITSDADKDHDTLCRQNDTLLAKIDQMETQARKDNVEINDQKQALLKQKEALDNHETYIRRESLIFSGSKIPAATQTEDSASIVRGIIRNAIS